jgi:hypothetical protein
MLLTNPALIDITDAIADTRRARVSLLSAWRILLKPQIAGITLTTLLNHREYTDHHYQKYPYFPHPTRIESVSEIISLGSAGDGLSDAPLNPSVSRFIASYLHLRATPSSPAKLHRKCRT